MKHHKNRSKHKKKLFESVLSKWHSKRGNFGIKSYKNNFTQSVVINALGAAAFLALSSSDVSAKDPTLLPEIVVTGKQEQSSSYKVENVSSPKYSQPLRDIPQTITVIPKVVMQDQGATTMRDVLRNVPGISIQAGEGGVPAGDNLSIRGFNARTDLFVDGVRDFGGYARDPFNMEQVEVAKGPSSASGGRGATGGFINMVSKEPTLDTSFSGSLGGWDQSQRYTVDINQSLEKTGLEGVAARFNAMFTNSNVPGRDVVENQRYGIAPTIAFGLGSPTKVTMGFFYLEQDNMPDYGIPWVPANSGPLTNYDDQPAPVDYSNFYGLKSRDYENIETKIGTLKIEHDFNETLSLRNLFRFGKTDRDSIITAPRFSSVNTNTLINRQAQSRDQFDKVVSNQTNLDIKFETASLEHTLVPGIEFARETEQNRARTIPAATLADLYDPNTDAAYTGNITSATTLNDTTSRSAAIYAFDSIKLNEHWQLDGGLRWDYFGVDYTPATGPSLERIDRMTSWRSGVIYKPVENASIYAAYGTSFNPSSEGLTLASTATATNNANIDPEENRNYEIGTKWDLFQDRLLLTAAIFRTEKTNARTEDPTNPSDIVVLEGEQLVNGIELGAAGNVTDKWQLSTAYTFMKSEITSSKDASVVGNELSNTPQNSLSIWNTYQLPYNFQIGGGVQYVDSRFSSNANTRTAPSYWLGDAMASYKVNENISMRLNVNNIADTEYIDRVGGGHYVPGAGRTAMLTTDFKF